MHIAWDQFTPYSALTGGLIIGLAVALFILVNGRIAGITGIVSGLLRPKPKDTAWRVAFILGLVAAPVLYQLVATLPPIEIDANLPMIVLAGFIVGIGTRYGSGCTSGHGVCGLSRLSPRSLVATIAFMFTGVLTVYVLRHLIGLGG